MPFILTIILALLLVTAIYTDLRWSRIPNWLTFSAAALAVALYGWLNGLQGVVFSLSGLGVGMGLFLLPYAGKAIGAGDVKLMAAIGSMLGPAGAFSVAALSVLAGGLYALGAMGYQWGLAVTSKKLAMVTYGAAMIGGSTGVGNLQLPFKLRYGLAIGAGTLLFLAGVQPFGG